MPFSTKMPLFVFVVVVFVAQLAEAVPEAWEVARIYQRQRHGQQKQNEQQPTGDLTHQKGTHQLRHKLKTKSQQFAEFMKRLTKNIGLETELSRKFRQRLNSAVQITADWQQLNGGHRWHAKSGGTKPTTMGKNGEMLMKSDQKQLGNESVQMCIFLRIGCGKINRDNYSQRLRDFANRMIVHEKVQNGLIIHRKPSEQ